MTYNLEQIKGEISGGGGVAHANLYRVILPVIPSIFLNLTGLDIATPQGLNVLCKNVNMPGRQLLTTERTIGTVTQKVAYGEANEDVSLTFLGLNNYNARKYFEDWMFFAVNPDNYRLRYKNEYARNVTIQQLDKFHRVVYSVVLQDAFPTQILNLDFSDDNTQPVNVGITLSYTRWRRNNVLTDTISTEAQRFLEGFFLAG